MNNTKVLIKSVASVFNLPNDIFIDMFLEEHIACVRAEHQEQYFKSLFGKNTEYKKPLDRIADATHRYKREHKQNNYLLSYNLAKKIVNHILSVNKTADTDKITLSEKIIKFNHSTYFTSLELKAIKYAGGLSNFISENEISIDVKLLLDCYNSAFFNEEPKQRLKDCSDE